MAVRNRIAEEVNKLKKLPPRASFAMNAQQADATAMELP
jgi:hypothetical protein